MKLTDEQEAARQAYSYVCLNCGNEIGKGYCGRCDEYYNVGHAPGCKSISDRDDHSRCG